jgi:hypothetical protein
MQFVIGAKMETLCANDIFLFIWLFGCLLYYSSKIFEMKINNE